MPYSNRINFTFDLMNLSLWHHMKCSTLFGLWRNRILKKLPTQRLHLLILYYSNWKIIFKWRHTWVSRFYQNKCPNRHLIRQMFIWIYNFVFQCSNYKRIPTNRWHFLNIFYWPTEKKKQNKIQIWLIYWACPSTLSKKMTHSRL